MIEPASAIPENTPVEIRPAVPWSLWDTVIGFVLFLVCAVGIGYSPLLLPKEGWVLSVYILVYQPLQFIPIWSSSACAARPGPTSAFRKRNPTCSPSGADCSSWRSA